MTIATADLFDERGDELDSLGIQLQDIGGRIEFDGPIRTVIDGGGSLESALVGDLIAASAVENGWTGVVVYGAVRDREAIRQLDIGLKALGSNPRKSAKDGVGEVDVPVEIGGVTFTPGKHVWADADGVLVER